MKTHFIAATALVLTTGFGLPVMAEDCQLPGMAKPATSFTSAASAPRTWKSGAVQRKLRMSLSRFAKAQGGDAAADHPLDDVDYFCDDWIAICADEDCNHGVVDCDGVCAPF